MKKIFLLLSIIIIILIVVCVGGYFITRYYLKTQISPEYLLEHPTMAKIFNVSAVCSAVCAPGGVCGKNGKNYCNQCAAFQHGAGYAHDGECHPTGWNTYINNKYGFEMSFPTSWNGYSIVEQSWQGHVINNYQQTYSGTEIIIKNPQTTPTQQWQDIPIMVFTPDVWKMVSGINPTVAVSAAPIGPEEIGENLKYVFATPPRWYGFTGAVGWQEAVNIVATFRAY